MTTLDADKPFRTEGKVDFGATSSASPRTSRSGQLQAEAFACSLGKVYTSAPRSRGELEHPRHLAEFWMVEPEMAFFDLKDNMDLAETSSNASSRTR